MSEVKYAVIAIGDSSYDTFCAAGKHAYDLLEDIGATPICDVFTIDVLAHSVPEDAAEAWFHDHIERL
ncbi:flavoprotein MioC [Vibrio ponticus]|nr:flavoprotein MioC [Vibrio ponticus]